MVTGCYRWLWVVTCGNVWFRVVNWVTGGNEWLLVVTGVNRWLR